MTKDGGAASFGSNTIYKFDKSGKEVWSKSVVPQFDELESQAVAEDTKGNLYAFMLTYDYTRDRGGAERIVCYRKDGTLLWDKTLAPYTLTDSPTISFVRSEPNGQLYMRGHIVKEKPEQDKDPKYRYWEGWLDSTGKLTQKFGDHIDWAKDDWQKKFQPE